MSRAARILIAFLLLGSAGCASMGSDVKHQAIFVQSDPPGAAITRDDKVIGYTPAYVQVLRGRKATVDLESAEGLVEVRLATRYRWRESFAANLIFFTYAPFGWIVDFATGTAWRAEDPTPVVLNLRPEDRTRKRLPERIAIAPPQSSQQALSDAAGRALDVELTERGRKHRRFDDTLGTFIQNDYDFDGTPNNNRRQELYYRLGVDAIYQSRIEPEGNDFLVKGQLKNVYTGEVSEMPPLRLASADVDSVYSNTTWWSRLLPNSVGLDFIDDRLKFTQDGSNYDSSPAGSNAWWAIGVKYLSAIDISNLPLRRPGRSARWQFAFIPKIRISRQVISVGGLPPTADGEEQQYTRWVLGAGYGPELGFQIGRHYLYVSAVPLAYWSETHWSESRRFASSTRSGFQTQIEAGYNYFFNANWFGRFFYRSNPEDAQSWKEALSTRLPRSGDGLSANEVTTAVAVGYRFEPRFSDLRVRKPASVDSADASADEL